MSNYLTKESKQILLSILIPTIPERYDQFKSLVESLSAQLTDEVEIIIAPHPKGEISIGAKRDGLYRDAKGKYSVQIDDDDTVPDYFVKECLDAIKHNPDCIGYNEHCTINGYYEPSIISVKSKHWHSEDGLHFRTPHFKTPILTSICQAVGVKDMRFGEDHDFAKRVFDRLKSEVFIDRDMYFYTGHTLTPQQHKERYGL